MHTLIAGEYWFNMKPDTVRLAVLPFFHVTGMQGSMSGPLYTGATVVLLPRWDRDAAARLIQRYRIGAWTSIPTMVVDFLANPKLAEYDLSSIQRMSGGGAAMPEAGAEAARHGHHLRRGYGLSETIAPSRHQPARAGEEAVPRHPPLRRRQPCRGD
ncbi:MAG: AMP-binding protein [Rhodocyclales bacterium]|nr:AMP-binding protein [Rhodocyclales bacterium]